MTRGSDLLRFNTIPAIKRVSPIKTQTCAALTRSCKYREAPMHRNTILNGRGVETKNKPHRIIILYIIAAVIIILGLYYLPNYFLLEKATADSAAFLLNSLGMNVQTRIVDENVFLSDVKIVKDCTGVQVIAVFFGMLIPVPKARLHKKLFTLLIISASLYFANVLRIALEFSLLYLHILPWSIAHYPLSLLLGVIGVLMLVLVSDRLLPEFGDFLFSFAHLRRATD